jgi:hypothetical protein
VGCARHLGGNGCERVALEIGVIAISRDIALVFGAKTIVALANGNLGGNPESAPQAGIAILAIDEAIWPMPGDERCPTLAFRSVEGIELGSVSTAASRAMLNDKNAYRFPSRTCPISTWL